MNEKPETLARGDAILDRLDTRPRVAVEIGVQRGELSAYLLRHRRNLHLIMVDLWRSAAEAGDPHEGGVDGAEAEKRRALRRYAASDDPTADRSQAEFDADMDAALLAIQPWRQQATVLRCTSAQAARWLKRRQVDLAMIDADHGADAVAEDLAEWEAKVKPGGVLCGHDYGRQDGWTRGVKPAVDGWAEKRGLEIELGPDHTWFAEVP